MERLFTAQVDRQFLETIKRGFGGSGLGETGKLILIIVLALLVILLALITAFNVIRNKLLARDIPSGWILGRTEIKAILDKAVRSRATMEMRFLPSDRSRKSTYCAPMDLTAESLVLEMTAAGSVGRAWIDRPVECFFRLRHKRDQYLHYAFTSTIVGIRKTEQDIALLSLELPRKVELHQKRAFLRVDPPQQYLLGLALWPEPTARHPDTRANIKRWGKPSLIMDPGRGDNPVSIINLSAGGIRLFCRHLQIKRTDVTFAIAGRFLLMLDIYDPELAKKRRYWFACRVQNLYEDFETRNQEVGLQFTEVGWLQEGDDRLLEWRPVEDAGVESLAAWVMKRHLELYRRTGLG